MIEWLLFGILIALTIIAVNSGKLAAASTDLNQISERLETLCDYVNTWHRSWNVRENKRRDSGEWDEMIEKLQRMIEGQQGTENP